MLEERVGEIGRTAIGLQDYDLPTPEQLLVELTAFSIPGVAFFVAETSLNKGTITKKVGEKKITPEAILKTEEKTEEKKLKKSQKILQKKKLSRQKRH